MPRDTTFLGTGTLLRVTGTLVANRVTIGGPTMAVASVDKTTLDDPKRRFRPGLPDAGEINLTVYYDPKVTSHTTLLNWWKTPGLKACELEFADGNPVGPVAGTIYAFSAFLTGMDHNGEELDSMLGADITLKLDGDITVTPSAYLQPTQGTSTMARDTTFLGTGTLLRVATVLVANRVTIGGPTMAVPSIDKTTLDDTKRRFRPGLPDAGEINLTVYYDPKAATHITLLNWWKTPGLKACELEFADGGPAGTPAGTKYAFDAFLTGMDHNGEELDSMLGADITLKLDGDVTITATTFT